MLSPRRIAFINEKGGSAKTTLVANLGAYLALHRGRRVLAIDMDPQGQLAKVLGIDRRARRDRREQVVGSLSRLAGRRGPRSVRTPRARAPGQPRDRSLRRRALR